MTARTTFPDPSDVRPATVANADAIQADGAYRALLDEALDDMGRSDLSDADLDAAHAVRDRATTRYVVQSPEEARALAIAATFVLNGGPQSRARGDGLTTAQTAAVQRVKDSAERLAVALTPAAHGLPSRHD